MRLLFLPLALFALCGCEEQIPDVSGVWKGSTTFLVDGEEKTLPLEITLTRSKKEITGSICWDEIVEPVSTSEISGLEIFLGADWERGSIQLRGLVTGDTIKGRFRYKFINDPEPFPALFEVTRQ